MSSDSEKYLLGLFDFEREKLARRKNKPFTLDRINSALDILNHPEKDLKFIHIAGTKGKGSTLSYIQHGLRLAGYEKIGLFSSPHLIHIRERIRVDDQLISDEDLLYYSMKIHELNGKHFNYELSFFEVLLLIAIYYFKKSKCNYVLLETGLGGRLDATNVVKAELSILSRIDYDHTDILGDTLELIAYEKACILKGNPVVALKQSHEINEVFRQKALETESNIHWVNESSDQTNGETNGLMDNINLAMKSLELILDQQNLPSKNELMALTLPGRLQKINIYEQNFLFDCAHNEVSLRLLRNYINANRDQLGEEVQVLFAMAESRPPKDLLTIISDISNDFNFCYLPEGRPGIKAEDLQSIYHEITNNDSQIIGNEIQLKEWLFTKTAKTKIICGSFYIVGEALKILKFTPDSLFSNSKF